ncbi:hypothetical protein GCM10022243_60430 [Saccharothrix violaceirubra]|uniref:Uncharacterized protein n=1 Tax=Saccharothrix violaceirubra TaxID=413306 RepID=A0A7W7T7N1_9PSEU|nr:hypothetical protein [Saccharothrix violaceirubra]MBB4968020.1 hypothetical protein [Saccharothrix violaceirubra]
MTALVDGADYARLLTIVEQRAGRYAEDLESVLARAGLRGEESRLLDEFEQCVSGVLDHYPARRRRASHELLFRPFYETRQESVDSERRRTLLVALMAAEVEAQGPLRLTMAQNKDLAEILERLGVDCAAEGLWLHAAEAFERAAETHLLTNDHAARDRCLFLQTRARHRIEQRPARRAFLAFSAVTCGYGYRPYRLLWWVLVQLVAFWLTLWLVTDALTPYNLYLAAVNYLNPAGTEQASGAVKAVLVVESYSGALSLNVFFALLVRRWFR